MSREGVVEPGLIGLVVLPRLRRPRRQAALGQIPRPGASRDALHRVAYRLFQMILNSGPEAQLAGFQEKGPRATDLDYEITVRRPSDGNLDDGVRLSGSGLPSR
jgi:hypothetical protein